MKKPDPKPQTEDEKMADWRRKRAQRGELLKPKGKQPKKESK